MTRATKTLAGLLLGIAVATAGCTLETVCTPVKGEITGDRRKDILGTWEAQLIDRAVVYVFREDGTYRLIEEPGTAVPQGSTADGPWTLDGDRLTLGATAPARIDVTESSLTIAGPVTIQYTRVRCSGYGF